jgi:hypothetical protein
MSTQAETGIYVYGILPGDIQLESEATGVGDPPSPVRLVRYRDIAALISDVDAARPLASPQDLLAHEDLLDASAAEVPVLPMKFGAVVASEDVVTAELLKPHYDGFRAALRQLEGRAEYVVKGRYVEATILAEVLSENPAAANLAADVTVAGAFPGKDSQARLSEMIGHAIAIKREQDARVLGDTLAAHVSASVARPVTDELDAVHAAVLVEAQASERLQQALAKLAADWAGRVELELTGPLAAYDFVGMAPAAAGDSGLQTTQSQGR